MPLAKTSHASSRPISVDSANRHLGDVDTEHGISMEQYADELVELLDSIGITRADHFRRLFDGRIHRLAVRAKIPCTECKALSNATRAPSPTPKKLAPAAQNGGKRRRVGQRAASQK